MRKEICPMIKDFCRDECGFYDQQNNQCAVLSIVEVLENLHGGLSND